MSIDVNGRRGSGGAYSGEEPLDMGRYLEVLRRSRWLIVAIVTTITEVVLVLSLTLPKHYVASASVVVNNPSTTLGSGESQAIQRSLATTARLATTTAVLAEAAASVPGETRASLAEKVTSTVEENAYIIDIDVNDRSPTRAAGLAYAVAQAFIKQRAAIQRAETASVLAALDSQIATLRARSGSDPGVAAQVSALQARSAELEATGAGAASQLQLVQRPQLPSAPSSPRPAQNTVIAFFASIFLAVLVALAREQLTPRVTNQRELGQLLGLPVLSGIPYIRRRVNARYAHVEHEIYQALSAAVRLALPASATPHVILVTSATHAEGKTTVTAQLGRMLAQAGHKTLLISGDLRWPKLDDAFDVDGRPGLRELLARASDGQALPLDEVEDFIVPANGHGSRGELEILPAGRQRGDASELLHTAALQSLIAAVHGSDYAYVLIDAPPILGVADAQLLAKFCERLLLVARLDRLRLSDVADLRDTLDRLDSETVGLVVIGTRVTGSPYYTERPAFAPGVGAELAP
jgi:capsular exopolysaccharide synthesis family protein